MPEVIAPPVVALGVDSQGIDEDEQFVYSLIAQDLVDALPASPLRDVNTLYDHATGIGAHLAEWVPLMENGSFRCVAYLMANGARPQQRLPAYYIVMKKWKGYLEHKKSVDDEILSGATAKLAAVLAKHYNRSEEFMLKVLQTNWHDFVEISWANNYASLTVRARVQLPTILPPPRGPLDHHLWVSLELLQNAELNVMHRAILIHGRDSRIARLLRGDSLTKIERAMRLGFDTFRRNVNWQMAIQKNSHMAALHALHMHLNDDVPELRKKIVHLALFCSVIFCVFEVSETTSHIPNTSTNVRRLTQSVLCPQ